MSKRNMLYKVVACKGRGIERVEFDLYETTKLENAEKFLHSFLKNKGDEYDSAYIERKALVGFNKRNYDYDEEDF